MKSKNVILIHVSFLTLALGCSYQHKELPVTKIAFGSCAFQWEPQPIWNTMAEKSPDLFLFLGDAIYGDWDGENVFEVTAESLERDWELLGSKPGFAAFRESTPILATWDNHDYGSHNLGASFKHKEMTKQKFLGFFEEVRSAIGKVGKYIPHTDPEVTLLGEIQWSWLQKQLQTPANIRLICSGTQIIPDQKGMDEWGCFPADRQRLLNILDQMADENVLLLSGNVHFAEISKLELEHLTLYEFTSSGMTHFNENYGMSPNKYRAGQPYIGINFGLILIDWEEMLLKMEVIDKNGHAKTTQSLKLK